MFDILSVNDLEEYINNNQEENLNLDFKTINRSDLSHSDDKKNFAKALSGFGNSSGGIIIWGIEAKKNADKIDCATSKKEIENLQLFLSKLNEFTGVAVAPIVDGVKHRGIPTTESKGFAITLIPESLSGPHMAKFREDRYYKRSGDSFYKMEHFDIEDMFGRRKKPLLDVYYKITPAGKTNTQRGSVWTYEFLIIIGITNKGRGSAFAPYLSINKKSIEPYKINQTINTDIKKLMNSVDTNQVCFGSMHDLVIHPNTCYDVTSIKGKFSEESRDLKNIKIEYELTANNINMISDSKIILGQEIVDKIGPCQ